MFSSKSLLFLSSLLVLQIAASWHPKLDTNVEARAIIEQRGNILRRQGSQSMTTSTTTPGSTAGGSNSSSTTTSSAGTLTSTQGANTTSLPTGLLTYNSASATAEFDGVGSNSTTSLVTITAAGALITSTSGSRSTGNATGTILSLPTQTSGQGLITKKTILSLVSVGAVVAYVC